MRRLALVVAVLAACGGDDDGGGSLTVEDLPGAVANAYCAGLVRCGAISDVASCRGLDFDLGIDPELAAAVNNGTVIFNEAEARLCIAGGSDTCEPERLFDNEHCDLVFEGTLGANAACVIGEQCLSGSCSIVSCPDACCPGTCVGDAAPERPRLGEACVSTEEARCIDSYCDAASGQCEAYKATGQSCEGDSDCARGYCTGVCTEYPSEGEPCVDVESTCDSIGLYCNATTSVCTRYALAGETCGASARCSPIYECNGSTCELESRLGESCDPQERDCIDSSYCDPTTRLCTAPKADGAACQSSSECIGDCNFDTMTCMSDPICI